MIPKNLVFIWFGHQLPWTGALAMASAAKHWKPERLILLHKGLDPNDPGVELVRKLPRFELLNADENWFADLPARDTAVELYRTLQSPASRANLLRLAVLYKIGGVYMDTDTITVQEPGDLLERDGFCGLEPLALPADLFGSKNPLRWSLAGLRLAFREICARTPSGYKLFRKVENLYVPAVNNAVLGSRAGNPFIEKAFETMGTIPTHERMKRFRLGTHLLQNITNNSSVPGMDVLPSEIFYPLGPEICAHWFRKNSAKHLDTLLGNDCKVVHWYNSVEARFLDTPLDENWVKNNPDTAFSTLAVDYL